MKTTIAEWNENGVCTNPEVVVIKMPKGCTCEIRLAADLEGGCWRSGSIFSKKSDTASSPCMRGIMSHADRGAAINAELLAAARYFQHEKKAINALEAFHDRLRAEGDVSALMPASAPALPELKSGEMMSLPIDQIQPNPDQPRKHFDPVTEQELADSIKQHGLLQPIAVREIPENERYAKQMTYEIILGERRWRAHGRAGLTTIEAKVYKGVTRSHAKVLALIENLHRDQMNAIEEAEGYGALIGEGFTQEQVAAAVGRSRPVVANALRVLELPAAAVDLIREKKLTITHGVALARFKAYPKACELIAEIAVDESTPSADLENGVPFPSQLVSEGLIVEVRMGWNENMPAALKKHPAYFKTGYAYYCFEPEHWKAEKKKIAAAKKAVEDKARAEAEEEAAKAKKGKKVSLQDLNRDSYATLDGIKDIKGLIRLVPEDKRATAKGHDNKDVQICTDPKLIQDLKATADKIISEDRLAKVPALIDKAREKIKMVKKVGQREIAFLLGMLVDPQDGEKDLVYDGFSEEAAKRQGVKLPSDFFGDGRRSFNLELLTQFGNVDQLAVIRVLMDDVLEQIHYDLKDENFDADHIDRLYWFLEVETLGLLEESDEGKKAIIEEVKLRLVPSELPATSKAAKKGGKAA